jgi:ferric-dicitrate binding protein FerR (iron transport regulator)
MLRVLNSVSRVQQAPPKTERSETSATPEAPPSRRLIAGAVAFVVAVAGIAFVARAFGGGGETKVGESPSITP